MRATLDGKDLFDDQGTEIQGLSWNRASLERTVPGLYGVLSIDMGRRSRKIKQSGVLRARSRAEMNTKVDAISACMDGDIHILSVEDGQEFVNLRMDSFKVSNERTSSGGVVVDYEIIYTQLAG